MVPFAFLEAIGAATDSLCSLILPSMAMARCAVRGRASSEGSDLPAVEVDRLELGGRGGIEGDALVAAVPRNCASSALAVTKTGGDVSATSTSSSSGTTDGTAFSAKKRARATAKGFDIRGFWRGRRFVQMLLLLMMRKD